MRRTARLLGLALAASSAVAASSFAAAAVPLTLTQQGRLFDASGAPLDTTVAIQFTVYDAASGGAGLWTEAQTITLDEGYFSAQLGAATPFPPSLWDGSARFVGVRVGSDPELSPRTAAASVPYAVVAGDVLGDIHP